MCTPLLGYCPLKPIKWQKCLDTLWGFTGFPTLHSPQSMQSMPCGMLQDSIERIQGKNQPQMPVVEIDAAILHRSSNANCSQSHQWKEAGKNEAVLQVGLIYPYTPGGEDSPAMPKQLENAPCDPQQSAGCNEKRQRIQQLCNENHTSCQGSKDFETSFLVRALRPSTSSSSSSSSW